MSTGCEITGTNADAPAAMSVEVMRKTGIYSLECLLSFSNL